MIRHAEAKAREQGNADRCTFVIADAANLEPVRSESVDAVTTRSVLIYVSDKAAAIKEFRRVLRPGGRISLFEPINSYGRGERPPDSVGGYSLPDHPELAGRLRKYLDASTVESMVDFDERDLVAHCERAGFDEVHLQLEIVVTPIPPTKWGVFMDSPPNPLAPSFREAMHAVLDESEREALVESLRPRVEGGGSIRRRAAAYLQAVRR